MCFNFWKTDIEHQYYSAFIFKNLHNILKHSFLPPTYNRENNNEEFGEINILKLISNLNE